MPYQESQSYDDEPLPLTDSHFLGSHHIHKSTSSISNPTMTVVPMMNASSSPQENASIVHRVSWSGSSSSTTTKIIPGNCDVLLGRGGKNSQHIGNAWLRQLAHHVKEDYQRASKREKSKISRTLVKQVTEHGGRFLRFNKQIEQWEDVGDEQAREKTSQTLRDAVSLKHATNRTVQDDVYHNFVSDASVVGSTSGSKNTTSDTHQRATTSSSPIRPPSVIEFVTTTTTTTTSTLGNQPPAKRRRTGHASHHLVVEDYHTMSAIDLDPIPLESLKRRRSADAVRRVSEVGSGHHHNWATTTSGGLVGGTVDFDSLEFDLFEGELLVV